MHTQNLSLQPISRPAPQNTNYENVARTMSSREIAQLTKKRNQHVKRDIEKMLGDLKEDVSSFGRIYLDSMNRQQTEYLLDREHTDCLLTGYSAAMRMAVIKRWRELEEAAKEPSFDMARLSDPKLLLALLTDNVRKVVSLEADNTELTQENQLLEQKVVADAPKVEFFNAVITSTSIHSVREVAQSIGTGQNRLFAFMRQRRWIDRHNTPYQGKVEAGYLVAEPHSYTCPETGERKTKFTCKVTGKGFTKLQSLWAGREADLLGGAA